MTQSRSEQVDDPTRAVWDDFQDRLESFLDLFGDSSDMATLSAPGAASGNVPHVLLTMPRPDCVLAELSGNTGLDEEHRFSVPSSDYLIDILGWSGTSPGHGFHHHQYEVADEPRLPLARRIRLAFERVFGITHPDLLSYRAFGPIAEHAHVLELTQTEDVLVDPVDRTAPDEAPLVVVPENRDELVGAVRTYLQEWVDDDEVAVDDDGDLWFTADGITVFVRVCTDEPVVEVFIPLVGGVSKTRQAAADLAVHNRARRFGVLELHQDRVILADSLPAYPFVGTHLGRVLAGLVHGVGSLQADVVMQTRGFAL